MQKSDIDKLVEDTLQSIEGIKKAEPAPFLATRIVALINRNPIVQSIWTKLGIFISRPSIAIAGILLIIILNTMILFISSKNNSHKEIVRGSNGFSKDEFAITTSTIYDNETPDNNE